MTKFIHDINTTFLRKDERHIYVVDKNTSEVYHLFKYYVPINAEVVVSDCLYEGNSQRATPVAQEKQDEN